MSPRQDIGRPVHRGYIYADNFRAVVYRMTRIAVVFLQPHPSVIQEVWEERKVLIHGLAFENLTHLQVSSSLTGRLTIGSKKNHTSFHTSLISLPNVLGWSKKRA